MKRTAWLLLLAVVLVACSDDPSPAATSPVDVDGGPVAPTPDAPKPPEPVVDAGAPVGDASAADAHAPEAGGETCTAAKAQLLRPVASVSSGAVTVLSDEGGVKTLFVDASAGGAQASATQPRLYLALETGTRVDVTDVTAETSTAWDLAIKRPILFTNGGDGGPGQGGATFFEGVAFDDVTSAPAQVPAAEDFFDPGCAPRLDPTGAVKTSFDGWYLYDSATNALAPKPGTWVVRGGTGKLFKIEILSYYATPEGGVGQAGGRFAMRVGAL